MRTAAVIFFLFLCSLVVNGKSYAQDSAQDHLTHAENISFAQQLKYLQSPGGNTICKNDDLPDETQLVSVDDDDEDFINRKHLLLSKYIVAFSSLFILLHQEHITTRRPELFGPDLFLNSPRFIVNRVIKI